MNFDPFVLTAQRNLPNRVESLSERSGGPMDSYSSPNPDVLFDDSLLRSLDFSDTSCQRDHGLSYLNPGSNRNGKGLVARPLERGDFCKGYLHLLSQLTRVGDYGREVFEAQFDRMRKMPGCHYSLVVEDPAASVNGLIGGGKIVASASLIVECKFVHDAAMRGRIEDVVVDEDYRGMHLGKLLLETLKLCCPVLGCYKVTLDCKEAVVPYYSKLGFTNEGQYFLTQRYSD